MILTQLQVKLQETGEITYLKAKKQQTRYLVTYLTISKKEKSYDWYFEGQRTTSKVNATFLADINKETGCASCSFSVNCNNITMVDLFSSWSVI